MGKPINPTVLDRLNHLTNLGGKALVLVESDMVKSLTQEVATLRTLILRLIPENWGDDQDAYEALIHLAGQDVPEALALFGREKPPAGPVFRAMNAAEAGHALAISIKAGDLVSFPPAAPLAPISPSLAPTVHELKDRALRVLDRRTPKTSQQIAVELGSPDRVDLLAALGQLCADGMAIREPGTGVYLARTSPCG
jgi:hypothetical protein